MSTSRKPETVEAKASRVRRSNAELLKIPRVAMQRIRDVARDSKMPVDQVFSDVLENGLLTISEMYSGLIEFRKAREARWKEHERQPDNQPSTTEPVMGETTQHGASNDFGNGQVSQGLMESPVTRVPDPSQSPDTGFGDAAFQRGLEAPSDESFSVDAGSDEPAIRLHEG